MYNTDLPRRADLPTSAQLKRSSLIAGITAAGILTFVVLPSEYGVDPTGVGGVLGLTQMGEIKMQLAAEAAQDAANTAASANAEVTARLDRIETILRTVAVGTPTSSGTEDRVGALLSDPSIEQQVAAPAEQEQIATPIEQQAAASASQWRDEYSFTLTPGQGTEVKLMMQQGGQARFHWTANGAVVNFDTHGDGGGQSVSYEQGRGVGEQDGILEAAFTGNHGWFWRNRTDADVVLTLRTAGDYANIIGVP
ncbi:hypothetical protein [Pannonibacter phragmitetus]|uniref:hypothetical protein n=1 Tax=Pannonibacter phragmitetus TaxID=121719 RepID=UPI000F0205D4|nr:hypothetical protein [Pannonibacter phragmitetus]